MGFLAPLREVFDRPLKHYRDVRKRGIELMMRIVDCLPEGLILQAAEDLRLLSKDRRSLSSDGEENMDFIFDRAIHDIPWPEKRGIEAVCDGEAGDFSEEERKYLTSHRAPVFSLYEVVGKGAGFRVRLRDQLRSGETIIIDQGMNLTIDKGKYMAPRIISWEGLRLTAGVGIPFIPETGQALVENFKWLYDQKKDQMDWDKMMRRHSNRFYLEYKRSNERILFV